jgi:hypothetical protein
VTSSVSIAASVDVHIGSLLAMNPTPDIRRSAESRTSVS